MAKQKTVTANGSFLSEVFNLGIYKRTQGKVTRQVTAAALGTGIVLGAWSLRNFLLGATLPIWTESLALSLALPGLFIAVGLWMTYRAVNYSKFADFLIAVEAEMNKVSWPTRGELIRASIVVIFVIFALALVLFAYDNLWQFLFKNVLGILHTSST